MSYRDWRGIHGSRNDGRDFRGWMAEFGLAYPPTRIRIEFHGIAFGRLALSNATDRIEVDTLTPETYRDAVERLR